MPGDTPHVPRGAPRKVTSRNGIVQVRYQGFELGAGDVGQWAVAYPRSDMRGVPSPVIPGGTGPTSLPVGKPSVEVRGDRLARGGCVR